MQCNLLPLYHLPLTTLWRWNSYYLWRCNSSYPGFKDEEVQIILEDRAKRVSGSQNLRVRKHQEILWDPCCIVPVSWQMVTEHCFEQVWWRGHSPVVPYFWHILGTVSSMDHPPPTSWITCCVLQLRSLKSVALPHYQWYLGQVF